MVSQREPWVDAVGTDVLDKGRVAGVDGQLAAGLEPAQAEAGYGVEKRAGLQRGRGNPPV